MAGFVWNGRDRIDVDGSPARFGSDAATHEEGGRTGEEAKLAAAAEEEVVVVEEERTESEGYKPPCGQRAFIC